MVSKKGAQSAALLLLTFTSALFVRPTVATCGLVSGLVTSFNNVPLPIGDFLLFTATVKITGFPTLPAYPIEIDFTGQSIHSSKFTFTPSDSHLVIADTVSSASYELSGDLLKLVVPSEDKLNEILIAAIIVPVASSDYAGLKDIEWTGTLTADTPGLAISIQFKVAHYSHDLGGYLATVDLNALKLSVISTSNLLTVTDPGVPLDLSINNFLLPGATAVTSLLSGLVSGLVGSTLQTVNDICALVINPGGKGEPHFSGGDGSHFDWSGFPGKTYCLISDSDLHINMGMVGHYGVWGEEKNHSLTWIRHMSILWGKHTIQLSTRSGPESEPLSGYMGSMTFDEESFSLVVGEERRFVDGLVSVAYITNHLQDGNEVIDMYEVNILNVLTLRLKLRPEVEILRTSSDAYVHFDFELPFTKLSGHVHGVLGQTFRSNFKRRMVNQEIVRSDLLQHEMVVSNNGEGFLDGHYTHYEESSLTSSTCKYSQYNLMMETTPLVGANSKMPAVAGSIKTKETGHSSPRKLLL